MCGIAGFTRFDSTGQNDRVLLTRMADRITHRGPDGSGEFLDDAVALAHRRLSIIDLSDAGTQPMRSPSGRYIIVYNGEIYNFPELRKSLERDGATFKGNSDTEVLITLYEREGESCLQALNGMFALAIWDTVNQSLFLARDRLGKKPLYFYHKGSQFVFASELKSILCAPFVERRVRADSVKDFFTYQYIPDPKSIFEDIYKLEPGHSMRVDRQGVRKRCYWDVSFANTTQLNETDLVEQLHEILADSVRLRMVSDVPLGAFLSGGVDSSAVVALMDQASDAPITTCSIGFDSEAFDEVSQARSVAERFNCQHHEFTVRQTVEDHLEEIISFFDEPFSDPSAVPTYFVSQLARSKVTVALAGDGGDENFAGYGKYQIDRQENRLRRWVPPVARTQLMPLLARALTGCRAPMAGRMSSAAQTLSVDADAGFFISNSFFKPQLWYSLVHGDFARDTQSYRASDVTTDLYASADTEDHLSRILYTDLKSYLPGDILVKVDRMSMANSLETRAPLLDYRVVEFAATLPSSLKLNGKQGKHILKQSMSRYLPDDILYRKKMGFSVPLSDWLKHELKPVAQRYLFNKDSGLSQYLDLAGIERIWNEHQHGRANHSAELWSMLMFEMWWQRYMVTGSTS